MFKMSIILEMTNTASPETVLKVKHTIRAVTLWTGLSICAFPHIEAVQNNIKSTIFVVSSLKVYRPLPPTIGMILSRVNTCFDALS